MKIGGALGVLAGRLKRRWLIERVQADFMRARDLYGLGLRYSEESGDSDQAYYHAINIAFLDLMALPPTSALSEQVKTGARRALEHCAKAADTNWRCATAGEAELMLGDLDKASKHYGSAIAKTTSPRQIDSMYSQAIRVAERTFGQSGVETIEKLFSIPVV